MAEIPTLEAAPAAGAPAAPAPGSKKKLSVIALVAVLVLGGGGAGAWFFLHKGEAQEQESAQEQDQEKGKDKGKKGKQKAPKEEPPPKGPALFVALDPPFVVNFEAQQLVRFLQITAQIMSRDPETIELLKQNDPIVRNDLLLLFANQEYKTISTREGKEELRSQALATVRTVVKGAGGKPNYVEAVYFTSFVMQ